MNIKALQTALLTWLMHNKAILKNERSVEAIAVGLYRQQMSDIIPDQKILDFVRYRVLLPLMRVGCLEYYNRGLYGISPSSILRTDQRILYCNVFNVRFPEDSSLFADTGLGILIYNLSAKKKSSDLLPQVPSAFFELKKILGKMTPLKKLIESWPDETVIDSRNFLRLSDKSGWIIGLDQTFPAVYKNSDAPFARRILKTGNNSWKTIPSRETNPDAFYLAVMYSQLMRPLKLEQITYYQTEERLRISHNYFPVLIERLLVLNTLLNSAEPADLAARDYHLSIADFMILNKIFDSKIYIR